MTDFWLYVKLGLDHVLDLSAYDHILFLVALCAAYSFGAWKRLLLLVTLFTVGHTFSLLLAHYDIVAVSGSYIEFLIPITILVTAGYNIFNAKRSRPTEAHMLFYLVTIFFGLIHGFGFARYYNMMKEDESVAPLLEFALGVEIAQIVIVLITLLAAFFVQGVLRFNKRDWLLIISSIVIGMTIPMLIDTWPF
ncbi:MAG: HupE/UreJ family protein [Bacteroidia bacterium]|nr:HupE/UreJ family protein [Bacteroidia bacterium]NNF30736.1 HupE/UreJ family protein [Flavobacteriaceae bacterium]MBT8277219.1 HupE/UreJ family protein [Bacteroidia bacterium]NNJ80744.1 HupE/UreJ family protein [Flavobacteriaceae bacterium]NNK54819.1 HupE/UreJ family protein [Flavobacteriaceae bacterium]